MEIIIKVFTDPKLMNYFIMSLYLITAIRWAIAGSVGDVCYWISALSITATVTFLPLAGR